MKIDVVGFDPSLTNWGIAKGFIDLETRSINVTSLDLIKPVYTKSKQVYVRSTDEIRARQLYEGALKYCREASAIFIETPVGSQNARAMFSYGVCISVCATLKAQGYNLVQVEAGDIKYLATGKRSATKQQMIEWATTKYPHLNWPTYKRNGKELITESEAEHMADAIGAIHAGANCPEFVHTLSLLKLI